MIGWTSHCVLIFKTLFERDQTVLRYFVCILEKADRVWVGKRLTPAAKSAMVERSITVCHVLALVTIFELSDLRKIIAGRLCLMRFC